MKMRYVYMFVANTFIASEMTTAIIVTGDYVKAAIALGALAASTMCGIKTYSDGLDRGVEIARMNR